MALHTGEVELRLGDYYAPAVNRCARLRDIAHGGQGLLSLATAEVVRDALPPSVSLRPLGTYRLRELQRPEQVFQPTPPDLPADFPPLRSLGFPNNLPVSLTNFIGREREISEVKRLLSHTRLVTLTGAGGCGKTRLALQVPADLLQDYPDAVWLVELAVLADPSLVPQVSASALGVRKQPGRTLTETLSENLRARTTLLCWTIASIWSPRAPARRGAVTQLPGSQDPGHQPGSAERGGRGDLAGRSTFGARSAAHSAG